MRLLQAKLAKLTDALMDTERQYAASVAREFAAGQISWPEMHRAYQVVRDGGIKGFLARWQESVPYTAQKMTQMALADPDAAVQEWSGVGMRVSSDRNRPPRGVCVVYVLFDDDNHPIYTGSTQSFTSRMGHHRRDKVWASWRAYRCRDRKHAYQVEQRFLAQFKPARNKQGAGAGR
jgi:predicted GIY-YIG superfamily endonuclease